MIPGLCSMKTTSILELMTADHTRILKLLHDVEKSIGIELVSLMKVFDTFEWALEKHIFIEEKAIFSSYSPKNISEGYKMVPELIQQHNEILNQGAGDAKGLDVEQTRCSMMSSKN